MTTFPGGPRLLADIGGTNTRFALETSAFQFDAIDVLHAADYPSLQAAASAYLASAKVKAVHAGPILHAAFAIANPVEGDHVKMTNLDWAFSIEALRTALALDELLVVNDFSALAMALPHLPPAHLLQVGGGAALPRRTIGLVGPGTGLGVSGIIPAGDGWVPLASEGGHVSFAPDDEAEDDLLRVLRREHPHVSAERLLSGPGLEAIYRALVRQDGGVAPAADATLAAAEITGRALEGSCPLCSAAVERFLGILGAFAGNVALTLGAGGGVYVGGGIVPRLGPLLERSPFRRRFEAKGRMGAYVAKIPTYVITEEYPAFFGVSAILAEKLR
jgi:glucokinase